MQINLKDGFTVSETLIKTLTLRKLNTGDLLDSEAAAEQLKQTLKGHKLVASPVVMSAELYRRSVAKLGDLDGPLSIKQLKELTIHDYELLINAYDLLNNPIVDEGVAKNGNEGR